MLYASGRKVIDEMVSIEGLRGDLKSVEPGKPPGSGFPDAGSKLFYRPGK